ncbi:MAG: TRAP transporter small permease [Vicinamibacterales bacterium]|nr:TRAP transporter permease DctQ [Acidobacteriota bacterium]MDP6373517.1 TRAP transporter small permease [Vicinamibacterales bacterium]MDP6608719.1 TRAP transporter small permease [Vicinamibacterales bacterium]HAK55996.1 TRAP transporter small permease [Acidobacteriota bacterium]
MSAGGIRRAVDRTLDTAVILLMAALVLDVLWQVATRYLLGAPSSWTEELATFLLIWLTLLAAAVALRDHAHLGIDYLTSKLPRSGRRRVETFTCCAVAAFCAIVLTYGGSTLVLRTLSLEQSSPALDIPMGYVYLALPLGGLCAAWYSVQPLIARRGAPREASDL